MTTTEIITDFELQVNDITELSAVEELRILNRVYKKVCNDRPWTFLQTSATATVSTDATGSYITMPTDFGFFLPNTYYSSNSPYGTLFVGTNNAPYQVISWNDRVNYTNRTGYVYLDRANSKIRFTAAPVSGTVNLPYIKTPASLLAGETPLIPTQFQEILVYGMAAENDILQLSDKAKSYQKENEARYQQYLVDMAYWDAQFVI